MSFALTAQQKVYPTQPQRMLGHLGPDVFKGFGTVYHNVLEALAETDLDYLQNVMEPLLYSIVKDKLGALHEEKHKVSMIGEIVKEKDDESSADETEEGEKEGSSFWPKEEKEEDEKKTTITASELRHFIGKNRHIIKAALVAPIPVNEKMAILPEAHAYATS
jgi:hypothetical protein